MRRERAEIHAARLQDSNAREAGLEKRRSQRCVKRKGKSLLGLSTEATGYIKVHHQMRVLPSPGIYCLVESQALAEVILTSNFASAYRPCQSTADLTWGWGTQTLPHEGQFCLSYCESKCN